MVKCMHFYLNQHLQQPKGRDKLDNLLYQRINLNEIRIHYVKFMIVPLIYFSSKFLEEIAQGSIAKDIENKTNPVRL